MISILFLVGICVIGILAYLGMKGTGAIWVWNFAKVRNVICIKLKTGLRERKAARLIKLEEDQTFIMAMEISVL